MFRAALRPATLAARAVRPTARAFTGSAVRRSASEHEQETHAALLPPGAPAGVVPTDELHATGLERLQVLGEMHGVKVFDYDPLDSSRIGTMKDPIKVFSWVRIIYVASS
jgi:cytochrome c oxidase subunit 5b